MMAYLKRVLQFFFTKNENHITEDHGLLNLVQGEKRTALHYVKKGSTYRALTLSTSKKVQRVAENIPATILFSKNGNADAALPVQNINIISDEQQVKVLFDAMNEMKFTHFKKFHKDLVILEIETA